jgi:DNA helicase-2/ATP-dependent DNA helicase PcrA
MGEKVAVVSAWDSSEEARAIGEDIEQLQRKGHALNDMAILVRAAYQMRELEDRFVTLRVSMSAWRYAMRSLTSAPR